MADGIQVPTAKELGINQHFHKAGLPSKVATTKEEADKLASDGWSDKPVGWLVYGPKGEQVTVYTAGQEADALAQGYGLEPPVVVDAVQLRQRTPMQAAQDGRKGKADA
jgi:hypothetical protein